MPAALPSAAGPAAQPHVLAGLLRHRPPAPGLFGSSCPAAGAAGPAADARRLRHRGAGAADGGDALRGEPRAAAGAGGVLREGRQAAEGTWRGGDGVWAWCSLIRVPQDVCTHVCNGDVSMGHV